MIFSQWEHFSRRAKCARGSDTSFSTDDKIAYIIHICYLQLNMDSLGQGIGGCCRCWLKYEVSSHRSYIHVFFSLNNKNVNITVKIKSCCNTLRDSWMNH